MIVNIERGFWNNRAFRSSHRGCSLKKDLRPEACNFIRKRLQHSCFLAKFAKFLRTPILKNICERLLLSFVRQYIFCHLYLTSHDILHYLWSADLSKSFSQLIMSIFIFCQFFFQEILPGEKVWDNFTFFIS